MNRAVYQLVAFSNYFLFYAIHLYLFYHDMTVNGCWRVVGVFFNVERIL